MARRSKAEQRTTDLKAQVAANIRTVREQAGLSREQLADRAGVTARYIYTVEKGDRNLSLDTVQALAQGLRCHVSDLISAPDKPADARREALKLAIAVLNDQLDPPQPRKRRKP
jgi:transcriptional regulator with XRE-family HTH domain